MPPFDPNPLKELLLDEGASLLPYGLEPPAPGSILRPSDIPDSTPLLAAAFGPIELEYASLRTDCVIIDRPDRAVIEVRGNDALEFLGRMLTADVAKLQPGESCNSFWLNRKGRIDADIRVLHIHNPGLSRSAPDDERDDPPRLLFDVEVASVPRVIDTLGGFAVMEEIWFNESQGRHAFSSVGAMPAATFPRHRLSLHGPRAGELLMACTGPTFDDAILHVATNHFTQMKLGGVPVLVDQFDTAGVPGYELYCPLASAPKIYAELLRQGRPEYLHRERTFSEAGDRGQAMVESRVVSPPESRFATPASIRLRPCGWFAYNIARIEAGTPLFKLDFGPDSLPAETAVIDDRVSFKKGCYLGQEIVARMHARGHPKQRLVALRFDDDLPPGPDALPPLPIQGERVLDPASPDPKPVGSITSSTFSPMLGRVPIAFAMLNWSHTPPGTRVLVEADGAPIGATVQDSLRFIP